MIFYIQEIDKELAECETAISKEIPDKSDLEKVSKILLNARSLSLSLRFYILSVRQNDVKCFPL